MTVLMNPFPIGSPSFGAVQNTLKAFRLRLDVVISVFFISFR